MRIRDDLSTDFTKSLRMQPIGAVKPAKLSVKDFSDYSYEPEIDPNRPPVGNIFKKQPTKTNNRADNKPEPAAPQT